MTLAAMLSAHDDGALAALASVGLVKRARRDLANGKVRINDAAAAVVEADGQTVTLGADGPKAATCSCPATGVCRHVVLAVIALREAEGAAADAPETSAREDLIALDEAALRKFAGADWDKALRHARISTAAEIVEDGATLNVQLPDQDAPVVFLAGQGLSEAVFKGAKTARRRVVTAAALLVRDRAGAQALSGLEADLPDAEVLAPEFLDEVARAVADSVVPILTGGGLLAEERLFDLSISARAAMAPRLTAHLRGLVRHGRAARTRDVAYSDAAFLSDAALVTALSRALALRPGDPALAGSVRATYRNAADLVLVVLGAERWDTRDGARGVRLHARSSGGDWYAVVEARAPGTDPGFSADSAAEAVLWGAAPGRTLVGQRVDLTQGRVAEGRLLWTAGFATGARPIDVRPVAHRDWAGAISDVAERLPRGLSRARSRVPVMLAPETVSAPEIDVADQTVRVGLYDGGGRCLTATLPVARRADAEWLSKAGPVLDAVLCDVGFDRAEVSVRPVTAYVGGRAVNLSFPREDRALPGRGLAVTLADRFRKARREVGVPSDPLATLCRDAIEAGAEHLRFGRSARLSSLADEAGAAGARGLEAALRAVSTPESVLRLAYLATELQREATLRSLATT